MQVAGIREACSVCGTDFDVQFRYQMEERNGGFSFYCSQKCLEKSQVGGADQGDNLATCDACAKRFAPELASQVMYMAGRRTYACSMPCRSQLLREASGVRLGEIAAEASAARPAPAPTAVPLAAPTRTKEATAAARPARVTTPSTAVAVPVVPRIGAKKPVPIANATNGEASPAPSKVAPEASTPASALIDSSTPRYIAVFNHKGGTGKTTTAVSIAAGLAAKGKRVLLVDTDAQGNVAVSLGTNVERSLYHVLVMGLRVSDAVKTVRPNLDLLPSNETLAAAELYLAGRQNRDRVLSERLSAAAVNYDYVVLDCSPSLSLMNQNALVFADSVLVPVACDYLSLVGVRQVIKTVKNVNAILHHPVQIWGVLPTLFDARAKICHEAISTLKQHFAERCLPPVRSAIKVKEAPSQGQTIFEYAAGSPAADDYNVVVDRIIQNREASQQSGPSPAGRGARPVAAVASGVSA
jgi:chromosome partitioning protein